MTGAEAIARTLESGGIEVCFANPGTTELHLMSALEQHTGIRQVLGLFEGVVTGAADGYARMAGKPAASLLHLGPGFANGIANLHNARRASSPVVNLVGDQATYHVRFDAPLTSDIESLARPVSGWVHTAGHPHEAAHAAAGAIAAARTPPGQVATLIVPADVAWGGGAGPANVPQPAAARHPHQDSVHAARSALNGGAPTLLLVGGAAVGEVGLRHAARISAATGCDLLARRTSPRFERGVGRTPVERVPYMVDQAVAALSGYRRIILAGAPEPVAFFAYPGKPSRLLAEGAEVISLALPDEDVVQALEWLADEVGAAPEPPGSDPELPPMPTGPLTRASVAQVLGHVIPENGIISDESVTTGRDFFATTHAAAPHTWLQLTGGAIGDGMPMATGAAIACPDRKVITLQADGSGMYTLQALWTQAREGLNVTTLIFSNRSYAILKAELAAAESLQVGPQARELTDLDRPPLDWVALARGMGVDGERVVDCERLAAALRRGVAGDGPYLVEAVM